MRNKYEANHVLYRDGVYYYVRRVPYDLTSYYDVKRLCFSLKTKSLKAAIRTSKSVTQRLEDYWLGLRLQNMDIPAIQVVKSGSTHENDTLLLSEACELYLGVLCGEGWFNAPYLPNTRQHLIPSALWSDYHFLHKKSARLQMSPKSLTSNRLLP